MVNAMDQTKATRAAMALSTSWIRKKNKLCLSAENFFSKRIFLGKMASLTSQSLDFVYN